MQIGIPKVNATFIEDLQVIRLIEASD